MKNLLIHGKYVLFQDFLRMNQKFLRVLMLETCLEFYVH